MMHLATDEYQQTDDPQGIFPAYYVVECYCGFVSHGSDPLQARMAFVEHADEQRANDAITAKR